MDNKKNDSYYFSKIIEDINTIKKYFNNASYEQFLSDSQLVDAIMFRLVQLIENTKNISTEFKSKHPEIKWGEIIGFRNGIVHEYGKTDYTTVYDVITKDLDVLKELFEQYLWSLKKEAVHQDRFLLPQLFRVVFFHWIDVFFFCLFNTFNKAWLRN